jgi:serine/threonine protein kinase
MASSREDPNRLVGTVVGGRFEIKALAALDGAGARYDAFDSEFDSPATVRVLHNIRPDDASLQKLLGLLSEVSSLKISGLRELRAVGRTRSRDVYYATEPVEGHSLAERLEQGPLLPDEVVSTLSGAGEILAQAHYRGVVHGALHPGAVVLPGRSAANASVQLLDFGLAPLSVSMNLAASGGSSAVTPYQSPEQAKGDAFDQRADVYALGALIFEALTGRAPYSGQSSFEVLALQLRGEAPSLARENARYQESPLQQIIDQSMQVKPGDRFTSMQAMVMALRRAGRAEATRKVRLTAVKPSPQSQPKRTDRPALVKARPAPKPAPKAASPARRAATGKKTKRSKLGTLALVIGAVLAVSGFSFLVWWSLPEPSEREAVDRVIRPTPIEPVKVSVEEDQDKAPRRRRDEPPSNTGKGIKAAIAAQSALPDPRAIELITDGNKALAEGQYARAISRFQRAKTLAPQTSDVARGLGMAHLKQGHRRDAASELRRYLDIDPSATDRQRIESILRELEQD